VFWISILLMEHRFGWTASDGRGAATLAEVQLTEGRQPVLAAHCCPHCPTVPQGLNHFLSGLLFVTADVYVLITSIEMLMSREDADAVLREERIEKCKACVQMLKRLYFFNQRIRRLKMQASHGVDNVDSAPKSISSVRHGATSRTLESHGSSKTLLSEEDKVAMKELRELFDLFDTDKSGNLSHEEVAKLLKSMGQNLTEDEVREVINLMDLDGSGDISFEELCGVMLHQQRSETVKLGDVAKELFAAFDVENTQYIERSEVVAVYVQLKGRASAHKTAERLRKEITDEDLVRENALTKEELKEVDQFFRLMDGDGSGRISEMEFVIFVHEMEAIIRA